MRREKNVKIFSTWNIILIVISVIVSIAFGISFIDMVLSSPLFVPIEMKIFGDFSELNILDEYAIQELDDECGDLQSNVLESYCRKIEYDGKTYSLYAYTFQNNDDGLKYFNEKTEQNIKNRKHGFFRKGWMNISNKYIAFSENRALYIEGTDGKKFDKFLAFMFETFSDDISPKSN